MIENGTHVFYWSMFNYKGIVRGSDTWFVDGKLKGVRWYVVEADTDGILWPVREDFVKLIQEIETELC